MKPTTALFLASALSAALLAQTAYADDAAPAASPASSFSHGEAKLPASTSGSSGGGSGGGHQFIGVKKASDEAYVGASSGETLSSTSTAYSPDQFKTISDYKDGQFKASGASQGR